MSRKLILTPFEHGFMTALNDILTETSLSKVGEKIDMIHLLLSAVTMAGVDNIQSLTDIKNTQTTLIKKIVSDSYQLKWDKSALKLNEIFKNYKKDLASDEAKQELDFLQHRILQLLFAMEANSSVLVISGSNPMGKKHLLPVELTVPCEILFSSIQSKNLNLPVVKKEIEKKDIKKIIEVFESKEYRLYKEAQSEIESNSNFTDKTVKLIEKAGKDLYKKNIQTLSLRDNIIKAVPLSAKVVDTVFGKLPGILAEYSATILSDYLKLNKTIPMYSCDNIWSEIFMDRLNKLKKQQLTHGVATSGRTEGHRGARK